VITIIACTAHIISDKIQFSIVLKKCEMVKKNYKQKAFYI